MKVMTEELVTDAGWRDPILWPNGKIRVARKRGACNYSSTCCHTIQPGERYYDPVEDVVGRVRGRYCVECAIREAAAERAETDAAT